MADAVKDMRRAAERFSQSFEEANMFDKNMDEEELIAHLEVIDDAMYQLSKLDDAMDEVKRQFNHMTRIWTGVSKDVQTEHRRLERSVDAGVKPKFR